MTKSKHLPHRVGFSLEGQTRIDGAKVPLTHFYSQDEGEIRAAARWIYLEALARVRPRALEELAGLAPGDSEALAAWQQAYGLVSSDTRDRWCRAHAVATLRVWQEYQTDRRVWADRDDVVGELVPSHGRRRRPQAERRRIVPAHMTWLVHYQTGESYSEISRTRTKHLRALDRKRSWTWPASSANRVSTVRDACIHLASWLRLELRRSGRGRPASRS